MCIHLYYVPMLCCHLLVSYIFLQTYEHIFKYQLFYNLKSSFLHCCWFNQFHTGSCNCCSWTTMRSLLYDIWVVSIVSDFYIFEMYYNIPIFAIFVCFVNLQMRVHIGSWAIDEYWHCNQYLYTCPIKKNMDKNHFTPVR